MLTMFRHLNWNTALYTESDLVCPQAQMVIAKRADSENTIKGIRGRSQ